MRFLCWSVVFLLTSTSSLFAADQLFDFKPVAKGVYAAIARPVFRANSNAAIILLDDGVMVVDAEMSPTAARAVIAEIKDLTDKPVKYVVITHFHRDHARGAGAYLAEWPNAEIISTRATREDIEKREAARMKNDLTTLPQDIDKLRADLSRTGDPKEKQQLQETLRQAEAYLVEMKTMQPTLPNHVFDQSLTIYTKSQEIQILWLGRGHTDGDAFVYLPNSKVLITGDSVTASTPALDDSYPYDWIRTIDSAEKLDFDYVIGGHGDVFRGKATFELWKQYLTDLMALTADAYSRGESLGEARKQVAQMLGAKYGGGLFPEDRLTHIPRDVEKAYDVVDGRTK